MDDKLLLSVSMELCVAMSSGCTNTRREKLIQPNEEPDNSLLWMPSFGHTDGEECETLFAPDGSDRRIRQIAQRQIAPVRDFADIAAPHEKYKTVPSGLASNPLCGAPHVARATGHRDYSLSSWMKAAPNQKGPDFRCKGLRCFAKLGSVLSQERAANSGGSCEIRTATSTTTTA
jgi:hypothetical protein